MCSLCFLQELGVEEGRELSARLEPTRLVSLTVSGVPRGVAFLQVPSSTTLLNVKLQLQQRGEFCFPPGACVRMCVRVCVCVCVIPQPDQFLGDLRSLVRFVSFWKKRAKSEQAKSNHL